MFPLRRVLFDGITTANILLALAILAGIWFSIQAIDFVYGKIKKIKRQRSTPLIEAFQLDKTKIYILYFL